MANIEYEEKLVRVARVQTRKRMIVGGEKISDALSGWLFLDRTVPQGKKARVSFVVHVDIVDSGDNDLDTQE